MMLSAVLSSVLLCCSYPASGFAEGGVRNAGLQAQSATLHAQRSIPLDPCSDSGTPVQFNFSQADLRTNNLGGKGPGDDVEQVIRYSNIFTIDHTASLVVSVAPGSSYHPRGTKGNGVHGEYGQIGVASGTSVDLQFDLFHALTDDPFILDEFYFSIFDIDAGSTEDGREVVTIGGFSKYFVSENTSLSVKRFENGRTEFSATEDGVAADNPKDPMNLTPVQANRAVTFLFKNTSKFSMTFAITKSKYPHGRFFLFAGSSSIPHECMTTTTTSPEPSIRRRTRRRRTTTTTTTTCAPAICYQVVCGKSTVIDCPTSPKPSRRRRGGSKARRRYGSKARRRRRRGSSIQ